MAHYAGPAESPVLETESTIKTAAPKVADPIRPAQDIVAQRMEPGIRVVSSEPGQPQVLLAKPIDSPQLAEQEGPRLAAWPWLALGAFGLLLVMARRHFRAGVPSPAS